MLSLEAVSNEELARAVSQIEVNGFDIKTTRGNGVHTVEVKW
jgi:hypothetical protein